jgi:hypothetical protein
MEASISRGSDGFGSSSSNTIRNYLSRVTCDTIQTGGGGGGNPPTNSPPRASPSPPVPVQPSPPTPPTVVVQSCPTTPEVSAPMCISKGKLESGGYACYSLNQLLPKDCAKIRWSISTCNGIVIRNSPRRLLSSTNTTSSSTSSLTFDEDDDDIIVEEDQASLTFSPAGGSTCSKSCVFSTKNRVCLLVSGTGGGDPHVITYRAVDRSNGKSLQSFQRTIPIQKNTNNSCRPANLQCI